MDSSNVTVYMKSIMLHWDCNPEWESGTGSGYNIAHEIQIVRPHYR